MMPPEKLPENFIVGWQPLNFPYDNPKLFFPLPNMKIVPLAVECRFKNISVGWAFCIDSVLRSLASNEERIEVLRWLHYELYRYVHDMMYLSERLASNYPTPCEREIFETRKWSYGFDGNDVEVQWEAVIEDWTNTFFDIERLLRLFLPDRTIEASELGKILFHLRLKKPALQRYNNKELAELGARAFELNANTIRRSIKDSPITFEPAMSEIVETRIMAMIGEKRYTPYFI